MTKEVSPEVLYRRRAGRFATKIRRQIKSQGFKLRGIIARILVTAQSESIKS